MREGGEGVTERQIEQARAICVKEKEGAGVCGDQLLGLSPVLVLNKNPSS